MIKIITSCICAIALLYGSVAYQPMGDWLVEYEHRFEWVAESTVELITGFEGKRHVAYHDSQGNLTIGVGHLITRKEAEMATKRLSEDQVIALLHQDLKKCSDALELAIKVTITRTQSDAMHSLCHNIGPDRMVKSDVIRYLNAGDIQKAANAFMNWTRPGLKKRREAERALFLAEI
jgi:lysozyme